MNIIGSEDFTRTDTIARKILDKLADDKLVSRYALNLALKAGMEAGLILPLPQGLSEFPHVRDMTDAEYRLFDPDCFGDTEDGRAENYLAYKLKVIDRADAEDCEISDAVAATYRDGILGSSRSTDAARGRRGESGMMEVEFSDLRDVRERMRILIEPYGVDFVKALTREELDCLLCGAPLGMAGAHEAIIRAFLEARERKTSSAWSMSAVAENASRNTKDHLRTQAGPWENFSERRSRLTRRHESKAGEIVFVC